MTFHVLALPILYTSPEVYINGEIATVSWEAWCADLDYGTGPVEKYTVYYGESGKGLDQKVSSNDTTVVLPPLKVQTDYEFAISCNRIVEGTSYEGPKGNVVKNTTGCRGKNIFYCP